ncbi:MAG: hypothetical protein ACFFDW_11915 [Candidatus Thorarchaeota archaeon]
MEPVIVVGYALTAVLLIVGIVLLVRSIQMKINIALLILVIVFCAVGNLLVVAFGIIIGRIGQLLLTLGFILLFFHYENIASRKPNMLITCFLLMDYALALAFNIVIIIYLTGNQSAYELASQNTNEYFMILAEPLIKISYYSQMYLVTIIGLTAFIRSFIIIIRAYKVSKSKPAFVDSIGLFFMILYRAVQLPVFLLTPTQFTLIITIALGLSTVGLLLILTNYLINSDYLYLLPFPIQSFMIYNSNGILCYSRKIEQTHPEMESKDHLITGAFAAISMLIEEILGRNAKIRYINAQQYQIYFNPLPNDSGTLVVIAYGESALFISSLRRFIANLSPELLKSLSDITVVSTIQSEIDKLIQQSYPYVNFAKERTTLN